MSKPYRLPYGNNQVEFTLPAGMQVSLAVSHSQSPLEDPAAAIRKALANPIGSPPLGELALHNKRVCILFTDITRLSPDALLVPALLKELEKAGVKDQDITLLCATGMHRPSTAQEKVIKLGPEAIARYRVIDHDARNPAMLVDLGTTREGIPLVIHRQVVEADLVLSTGVVEPHQYAGYSGGCKTAVIGAGGEALIAHTHGPAFVDHPGTRLGRIDGNPFQQALAQAASRINLRFIINVVQDEDGCILQVAAGDPVGTFRHLVAFARSLYEVPISRQADIAIGGIGFPKDSNLYQASRAASYLYFAPTPVVRAGGFIILPARCEEGAGTGVGEERFLAAMREAPDIQTILSESRRLGYPPGQQRAFVMAKVLESVNVVIVGSEHPDLVAACKMIPATSMDEALALAARALGPDCRVLIVPHALQTLPIVQG